MKSTQIMSIGTALRRAMDARVGATVYVGPHKLTGMVEDIDSHGVLLWDEEETIRVVKLDSIDAVEIERSVVDPDTAIPLQAVGS